MPKTKSNRQFHFFNPWKQLRCGTVFFSNAWNFYSDSSNPWKLNIDY